MSSSREDYLQAIFRISKKKGYATNKEIAEYLNISKPSVTEMIKKLVDFNMVEVEKNKITLKEAGKKQARDVLSTHRLWEYFLENKLGLKGDVVHHQADLLEHITSDELKDALNKYLGYPSLSPKGNIIYENEKKS